WRKRRFLSTAGSSWLYDRFNGLHPQGLVGTFSPFVCAPSEYTRHEEPAVDRNRLFRQGRVNGMVVHKDHAVQGRLLRPGHDFLFASEKHLVSLIRSAGEDKRPPRSPRLPRPKPPKPHSQPLAHIIPSSSPAPAIPSAEAPSGMCPSCPCSGFRRRRSSPTSARRWWLWIDYTQHGPLCWSTPQGRRWGTT